MKSIQILANVNYNLGNALFNLKRYAEAVKAYDREIEINPKKDRVNHNRGMALFKLNRFNEAIKALIEKLKSIQIILMHTGIAVLFYLILRGMTSCSRSVTG